MTSIPRLLCRGNDQVGASQTGAEPWRPLTRDDFSDYFAACAEFSDDSFLDNGVSLNTIRGCPWSRCRFCTLHQNLSDRYKEPDLVIDEVRELANKYGVRRIHFANQDIQGRDLGRFEALIDGLSALRNDDGIDIEFSADITAARLSAQSLKRMALAGFHFLLVGFEAMTDGLLERIDKPHRFAHNILFMKLTDKFKIASGANILMGAPDETSDDVLESIQNLHYLRFYPPGVRGKVWIVPMYLGAGAPYVTTMSDAERARWVIDDPTSIYGYLPEGIKAAGDRMELGYFRAPLRHPDLWADFRTMMTAYQNARREYQWHARASDVLLHELYNGTIVKDFTLDREYYEVLRLANDKVISLSDLRQGLERSFPGLAESRVKDIVADLQREYLLYADKSYQAILSVVDTDHGPGPI